jgi:hypothetical protein
VFKVVLRCSHLNRALGVYGEIKKLPEFLFDISKWGAFKIPAISVGVALILLLFRYSTNPEEIVFIPSIIKFAIGSAVIAYCQSLAFSSYCINFEKNDLPMKFQILFMGFHIAWFASWFIGLSTYKAFKTDSQRLAFSV